MPDRRSHRGPHPGDRERFAEAALPALRTACADLAWLLARGYGEKAALQIVGDRFALDARQRQAVRRATSTTAQRTGRAARMLPPAALHGARLWIDGFNVLTTVEAALSGGVVLACQDGCYRDLASMHGTWRRVAETGVAAERVGELLAGCDIAAAVWLLDQPVGNSGRLAALLRRLAAQRSWPWQVELSPNPDRQLRAASEPIATADSAVLDADVRWVDLARQVVAGMADAWVIALDASDGERQQR